MMDGDSFAVFNLSRLCLPSKRFLLHENWKHQFSFRSTTNHSASEIGRFNLLDIQRICGFVAWMTKNWVVHKIWISVHQIRITKYDTIKVNEILILLTWIKKKTSRDKNSFQRAIRTWRDSKESENNISCYLFLFSFTHDVVDDLVFSSCICSWCLSLNPNDYNYDFGGFIGQDTNVVKIYP